jgi:hypothetical protein
MLRPATGYISPVWLLKTARRLKSTKKRWSTSASCCALPTLDRTSGFLFVGPCCPTREFNNAEKIIVECELSECPHCGQRLKPRNTWHMRKTVQTLYRQFLVFLGVMSEGTRQKPAETSVQQGGLIWALDALQPDPK